MAKPLAFASNQGTRAACLYSSSSGLFLVVTADKATLVHDEHKPSNYRRACIVSGVSASISPASFVSLVTEPQGFSFDVALVQYAALSKPTRQRGEAKRPLCVRDLYGGDLYGAIDIRYGEFLGTSPR